ncbi:L,D-transpeptidase family protein [Desulfofundulus thermocisternus]|uniref:L,D-transpeptidase family protein n=1 Tax=Desulfofundulus thermocisternus TaxID=42471 RepID=UPI0019F1962C|nr:L,D-transpeptidase family protein [Desulfofundulus thermocisternus]MBE3585912.1 L,D-transpeptidase family protein [Thermoanaerobacter sp.]MCS5696818.1 L,D-transpeptidase family protein [Desulfofundulus thermocisternus]
MSGKGVTAGTHLLVETALRRLHHFQGDTLVRTYPVAVGKPETPTPAGDYHVVNKIINPGGVLGTRWMGLDIPGGNYGIHGTNNPGSIGKAVSNGCIRMYNHHIEELFPRVQIGTPVRIVAGASATCTGSGQEYVVQPGDTLWQIARRFDVPLFTLIELNSLANPHEIYPGQVIVLPGCQSAI